LMRELRTRRRRCKDKREKFLEELLALVRPS
jgi:hypothetical protein